MPMRKLDVVDRNGTLFKCTIKHEKRPCILKGLFVIDSEATLICLRS